MLIRNMDHVRMALILVILVALIWVGCAAKKDWWGDPETGLTLEYRMPKKGSLQYQVSNDFTQVMEIMGQSMEIHSRGLTVFSAASKGIKDNNHQLEVTIDSMYVNLVTPRGDLSPDMSTVMGKSFDMTLSLLGKELELSGADDIQYELGASGKRGVGSEFQAFFPNLAGRPIKVGDTWESQDTVLEKDADGELRIIFEGVNTLDGFETVKGMECARISVVFEGTLSGRGKEGPLDLISEADIEGTETWYFAYKKGVFVKMTTTGVGKGTITATGPQEITIPMTREFAVEVELTDYN